MPSCVQNAMMTKDKKPFTYTPGGIDLSQIKSPRMAQRISRNANMEGVTNQPKPSPLAQVSAFFNIIAYLIRMRCLFNNNGLILFKLAKHKTRRTPAAPSNVSFNAWFSCSSFPTRPSPSATCSTKTESVECKQWIASCSAEIASTTIIRTTAFRLQTRN